MHNIGSCRHLCVSKDEVRCWPHSLPSTGQESLYVYVEHKSWTSIPSRKYPNSGMTTFPLQNQAISVHLSPLKPIPETASILTLNNSSSSSVSVNRCTQNYKFSCALMFGTCGGKNIYGLRQATMVGDILLTGLTDSVVLSHWRDIHGDSHAGDKTRLSGTSGSGLTMSSLDTKVFLLISFFFSETTKNCNLCYFREIAMIYVAMGRNSTTTQKLE